MLFEFETKLTTGEVPIQVQVFQNLQAVRANLKNFILVSFLLYTILFQDGW